ncbi:MAG: F1F0 ATP synthase assembly protein [Lasallia pustulata]|uniref:F1F0 ATP synthase assembly protein n=1 Tax=Lasallia pustulata TaxID=136370 RepID=A0A5M8PPM6_9LECA|nr:MAG: F1F0 ATP synthase assembly protein [Lasallia pustulata]
MVKSASILTRKAISTLESCVFCQFRRPIQPPIQRASTSTSTSAQTPPPSKKPKPSNKPDEDHNPKPLDRPLGQRKPPRAGENRGTDTRTWRQRRDDFFNYDKHLERRRQLTQGLAKPYFREWTNMRYHKGKTFVSNPRLFRADKALYFPNLQGITLATPRQLCDTTPVLKDRVSIVSVFSETWAERQVATFVGEKENPELQAVLREGKGVAQRVEINYEPSAIKAALIRLFMPGLRRRMDKDAHGRYFVVRRGVTEEMRDDVGWINSKVGYVYLVDRECKIRWAGSGRAEAGEKAGLVAGVRRLVEEYKKKP